MPEEGLELEPRHADYDRRGAASWLLPRLAYRESPTLPRARIAAATETLLLFHNAGVSSGDNRAWADDRISSSATLGSGRADSFALTCEATAGAGDRAGGKRRRSQSALASTASSRDWSCTRRTGASFTCSGRFLEAGEAFARAGRLIRAVLSKTAGAAVSAG
jgi:hypothetical protein